MTKECTVCKKKVAFPSGFYSSKGKTRSECKKCTSRRNTKHQKANKIYVPIALNPELAEHRKIYMKEYYAKHKEAFDGYRKKMILANPNYYRDYHRKQKNKSAV